MHGLYARATASSITWGCHRPRIRFGHMPTKARVEIRPFADDDLEAAAALLAERHRRHRRAEPALDLAYEASEAASREVAAALAADGATAWVATRGGAVVGYMIGSSKADPTWGPNIWIGAAGHAALEPEIVRELYAAAAAAWVEAGRMNHHVLVP